MLANAASSLNFLQAPGEIETVLLNAGELPLLVEVLEAAEQLHMPAGAFAALAVRRFFERAEGEDWTTLTSHANAKEDAMGAAIAVILRKAVGDVKEIIS